MLKENDGCDYLRMLAQRELKFCTYIGKKYLYLKIYDIENF